MKFFVEKGLPSLHVRDPQLGYIYIYIYIFVYGMVTSYSNQLEMASYLFIQYL